MYQKYKQNILVVNTTLQFVRFMIAQEFNKWKALRHYKIKNMNVEQTLPHKTSTSEFPTWLETNCTF